MYRDRRREPFLEVTYQNGDKEVLYFKDFSSGAMIENIVRRAKKLSIKRTIAGGRARHPHRRPPRVDQAGVPEHEDLPNTTNPDDWAKISGKKGERIVYIRTASQARRSAPARRRPPPYGSRASSPGPLSRPGCARPRISAP
jgi:proteasome-associated ATPase